MSLSATEHKSARGKYPTEHPFKTNKAFPQKPLTFSSGCKRCTISTRSAWLAITCTRTAARISLSQVRCYGCTEPRSAIDIMAD